ncbi:MAG: NADH-quinone oxidoreductase subunit NuoF [Fidelibacterota bacterium]
MQKILTANSGKPDSRSIRTYMDSGGYSALRKVMKQMNPQMVIDEIKRSNLRGRGGAGFPAGVKWSFVPRNTDKPVYLICNADESEPGTFKDRLLIEIDPHMILEGMIICAYAINSQVAYIYIRGEFAEEANILERAIEEAKGLNFLGENILNSGYNLQIYVHRGAGAYICGEETGLIESMEGKRGWPRNRPPFPAVEGLFGCPTVVNNVETLANVPHIIERGADWFRSIGPDGSPGPKLYCVSGHVKNPGVFELPMGTSLREIIYEHAGGIINSGNLKAVIPGGSSVPVLKANEIDVPMDFESLKSAGTMLGSAGIIVMDETTCMVNALLNIVKFYAHESCGQCTPCREGAQWLRLILSRIEKGRGFEDDLAIVLDICENISLKTICPFGDAIVAPVQSFIEKFRDEFLYHIENRRCPVSTS